MATNQKSRRSHIATLLSALTITFAAPSAHALDEQAQIKLGADILRLWVASTDYTAEMTVSDEIFKRTKSQSNARHKKAACTISGFVNKFI